MKLFSVARESNGNEEMDDPERTMSRVSQFIEQLHTKKSSPPEKELTTARLLGMAKSRKEARVLIGSHGQAMPLFVSILRTGTLVAKLNVAATLGILCRDEDLRVKVLLGGCVPPLLSMLKSESIEARKAAAEVIHAVSSAELSDDPVGMKIFVTEGVVPTLWEQLNQKSKHDKVVEAFVTGALRNLCGDKEGYWATTLEAGGVDIIVRLLSSENPVAQSNAASLLARLILSFSDSIPKIIDSKAINALLGLLDEKNDVSVRASAAEALQALSSKSTRATKFIVDAQGMPALIGAIVAPSKEGMHGEAAQELQRHATQALSNIMGGMSSLIIYLGELSRSPRLAVRVPDIIGALAYTLMVFEHSSEEEIFDVSVIENILVTLLKPRDNKLIQERILEAMASLYSNAYLVRAINQSETKRVMVGLIALSVDDVQEYLILALMKLCCDGINVWEAIGKKEGIQLLISFLGLSSEQHQEYAVQLLAILIDQVDDSKWAITAAGGIPPLVHLLETGPQKARDDGAYILWNLCCHSEEIRACVESAGAIPFFLWLLKHGGPKGQEASAKALAKLITIADSATINELLALLLGDSPKSKDNIIKVLGHVLSVASHSDLVQSGAAANKGLRSLVQVLNSSDEKTQKYAASVLANLFSTRHDICDSFAADDDVNSCMKLLTGTTQDIATQSPHPLSALPRPNKTKSMNKKSYMAGGDVKSLIKSAKTSSIDTAETAVAALAKLFMDPQLAAEALAEDVVSALTRVFGEGSTKGKKHASNVLNQLLRHFSIGDVLTNSAQCRFVVLSILEALNAMDMDGKDAANALEVIAKLARIKEGVNSAYPLCSILAEVPSSLEALVHCLCEGSPQVQDKAIEILSHLCGDQARVVGDALVSKSRSIGALADRIVNSTSPKVRVEGTALLVSATKEHRLQSMKVLHKSGYLKPLVYSLVEMIKQNSTCNSLEIEVRNPRGFIDGTITLLKGNEVKHLDSATFLGGTIALWLLSIISSYQAKNKLTVIEAGGLEALSDKLASQTSNVV